MDKKQSFKHRVKEELIKASKEYRDTYLEYDYLVLSEAFSDKPYYIISSEKDNFLHLTGVNTALDANSFYKKCVEGSLDEEDFNFEKTGRNPKEIKGSVRRKLSVLSSMMNLFEEGVVAEECFERNSVQCTFVTADGKCTLGYAGNEKVRPKSLMKGNKTKNAKNVDVVIRRKRGDELFNQITVGDKEKLEKYIDHIVHIISDDLK